MSKQINYYQLDTLDTEAFKKLLAVSLDKISAAIPADSSNESWPTLDELAVTFFGDETISEFLLLLSRLPVFSKEFEMVFCEELEVLNILKKLKFFVNLKIRETLYLLVKLTIVAADESKGDSIDIARFFSAESHLVDLKFNSAIRQNLLFRDETKQSNYLQAFERLEKIEPHAMYPTSIYRQSDGCTVANDNSQKIEAVMSTTLTTSIRISMHVLGYDNQLLAEIYRPMGRAIVVLDSKLDDAACTSGDVEVATNRRAILGVHDDKKEYTKITIAEQLKRYFAYHGVETTVLVKSGDEVDKDIEKVQEILIDMKKLGVMRHEPVLIVGGGVIADVAGFALALFHRNTPYVMLSTSIVAGIDAGPSPRTCSDGQGFKNAFGAFHPPVVTLTDRTLWCTMHPGMIRHGIAEIVKMACVENYPLFELLEKVGPQFLVQTKFGTDLSSVTDDFDRKAFDDDCERIVGMAMESYVRAEYGNLWETHQCRPHAFGHTWSPGYELPAGLLHGHAVATCMGFGAYLAWKHCDWINEAQCDRICRLINDLELALWHDVMDDKQIFHASTKKMIQKRGGNLVAPLPRGAIGECGYLNEITNDELSRYVDEYKEYIMTGNFARNGYGVEPHLADVGLAEMTHEATAHVRAEDNNNTAAAAATAAPVPEREAEEKKDEDGGPSSGKLSYNEWIQEAQAGRNADWKWNVKTTKAPDTPAPPVFPHNTLFHNKAEEYAMNHTTVASVNVQTAAKITQEENLFAPCMVGTLESQFLKMMTKTKKAKTILDVGTFTGMSAIAFAEGALAANKNNGDGVVVHTLEFDGRTAEAAQKIIDHCEDDVKNVIRLHHTDAVEWMRACADNPDGPTFDIVFIDADKDNYVAYYDLAMGGGERRSLLAKEGIILADNSLSALVYDQDDDRRVALHRFNEVVKNDDRVEQAVMTVREGITMISRIDD